MKKRPTSVTVVAWILIAIGAISGISTTVMINNPMMVDLMSKSPMPIPIQWAIAYMGFLILIVSGVAILKGRNWARFLYVTWSIIGIVVSVATSPLKTPMIPGVVFFLVITFFLFRPKATAYFLPAQSSTNA